MVQINLDFDLGEVQTGFEPVPEGTYCAKIVRVEQATSSNGNPMLKVRWEIIDGEYQGRYIFDNVPLIKEAGFRLKAYTELIGITEGTMFDDQELDGVEGIIDVVQEIYNDEPRAKIKKISPVS